MKSFKRILVLTLAVVMCLTAFAISSSAANAFDPSAQLLARYNENGDKIIVSVTTTQECGAMMATLTYNGKGISLSEDTGRFIEDAKNEKPGEFFETAEGQIKFAVVTDDVTKGSTHWADIVFDVDVNAIEDNTVDTKAIRFKLDDIQVCDINETLDDSVTVDDETVKFQYKALRGLGAQKRVNDSNNAIRFGTRVDFEGGSEQNVTAANKITIEGETYTARRCGYSLAYTNNVKDNFDNFGVELTNAANSMDLTAKNTNTTAVVRSTKYYKYSAEGDFFVYTLVVSGLNNDTNKAKEISVRPYVIYEADEADAEAKYVVINGDVLTNSYNGVNGALTYIGDLGTNYYE